MMTISESQYSSNQRSSIHTINDRVVHRDSYDDTKSSSSVNSALVTKRGFKPSDMFDPQKKEFLTNLSYKLFPVSWKDGELAKEYQETVEQQLECPAPEKECMAPEPEVTAQEIELPNCTEIPCPVQEPKMPCPVQEPELLNCPAQEPKHPKGPAPEQDAPKYPEQEQTLPESVSNVAEQPRKSEEAVLQQLTEECQNSVTKDAALTGEDKNAFGQLLDRPKSVFNDGELLEKRKRAFWQPPSAGESVTNEPVLGELKQAAMKAPEYPKSFSNKELFEQRKRVFWQPPSAAEPISDERGFSRDVKEAIVESQENSKPISKDEDMSEKRKYAIWQPPQCPAPNHQLLGFVNNEGAYSGNLGGEQASESKSNEGEPGELIEANSQPAEPEYPESVTNDGELSGVRDEAILQPPEFYSEDLETKPAIIGEREVDLNKIFTPAPDAEEHIIKKDRKFEKTFASSAFYVPGVHPTVKEQMDLARAISKSLSDSSNHMSRGQSMYVNRKKRSVKWVHEGRGRNTNNLCSTPTPTASHDTAYRPPSALRNQKTYPKSALKHSPNSIPKMEPFPVSAPTISIQNQELPVPLAPTKLNDVYASPKSPRLPLVCGPNFNVAPRGWGEMKDFYRPVSLDVGAKGYSDF